MNINTLLREQVKGRPELGPWLAQHWSSRFGSPSRVEWKIKCCKL